MRIPFLRAKMCILYGFERPLQTNATKIPQKGITQLPVDMQTQSAVSHKPEWNLWGIMKTELDRFFKETEVAAVALVRGYLNDNLSLWKTATSYLASG